MPDIITYLNAGTRITGTIKVKVKPDEDTIEKYVMQRVEKGSGNIPTGWKHDLQLRRHVIPADPKTPTQLAGRARIRAATQAWQDLTEEEKQEWRDKAKNLVMTGFNLHIKEYCRTNPLANFMEE